jgi:hypothetical protein
MMQIQKSGRDQWTVPSQTKPGVLYIVRRVNGNLTCDCDGGFFCGRCKHQVAVADAITPKIVRTVDEDARAWGLSVLTGRA